MKLNGKVSWLVDCVKKVYFASMALFLEIDQNIQLDAIVNFGGIVLVLTTGKTEKMPQYRHRLLQPVVGVVE